MFRWGLHDMAKGKVVFHITEKIRQFRGPGAISYERAHQDYYGFDTQFELHLIFMKESRPSMFISAKDRRRKNTRTTIPQEHSSGFGRIVLF